MNDELKIGLAFSGGGYRAAAFSLGVLTYLDRIKIEDETLLDHVCVLSTVSGGTITGAGYTVGKKKGETMGQIYEALYRFMTNVDLVSLGIDKLVSNKAWPPHRIKGLITVFADIYDQELFKGATFGALMADDPLFHLKHISFNATDFKSPLQFRFQWSEKMLNPGSGEPGRGVIGNGKYNIPEIVAKEIRMGDIVAASSCFPGGFEPINFPNDFIFPHQISNLEIFKNIENIGLMDGGIVDNQGIEPVILADDRMNRNRQPDLDQQDSPERALDLVIVSDVASPFMEKYVATVQHPNNWWRVLTPNLILILNNLFLAGALYGLITSVMGQCYGWVIVFTVVATVNILIDVLAGFLIGRLRKVDLVRYFRLPLRKLLNLRLRVYETMVVNRVQSVMKMTGEVFMKHLRRLNYRTLYHDKTWKNRLIMNAIYELVPGKGQIETKKQKNSISTQLVPSFKLQAVAEKAAATSTTLWFTKQELHPGPGEKSQPDVIIACGQFNICLNLLEYIEKLEKNRDNTNANHDLIIGCKDLLLKDWNKFQDNPFWMVEEIHQGFAK